MGDRIEPESVIGMGQNMQEGLLSYLNSLGVPPTKEKVVRGYKVRTVQQTISPEDVLQRRKTVAEVIARSLRQSRKTP